MSNLFRRRTMVNKSSSNEAGPFGNVMFYQFPLVYENGVYRFQTAWNEINTYHNYTIASTSPHTYFWQSEIKDLNLDGYRVPSEQDISSSLGDSTRIGATYNGISGVRAIFIYTDNPFATMSEFTQSSALQGVIHLPDGANITGPRLPYAGYTGLISVSLDEIDDLLAQKVLFIPNVGCYNNQNQTWTGVTGTSNGNYWCSTYTGGYDGSKAFDTNNGAIISTSDGNGFPVVMCRNT